MKNVLQVNRFDDLLNAAASLDCRDGTNLSDECEEAGRCQS
ncbi:MAG: hypothetical protein AAF384_11000 [Pseudomonadota bacterium]